MTPKHEDFNHNLKLDVAARVRQGVNTVLQEERSEHLEVAGYRELTSTRRGELKAHTTSPTCLRPPATSSAWRCLASGRASS